MHLEPETKAAKVLIISATTGEDLALEAVRTSGYECEFVADAIDTANDIADKAKGLWTKMVDKFDGDDDGTDKKL